MRFLLCLCLCACGNQGPDFVSSHGVMNFLQGLETTGMSKEIADAQERELLTALQPYGFIQNTLNVPVYWYGEDWKCPGNTKEECAGEQTLAQIDVSTHLGCVWRTAYRHELLHFLQQGIGIDDPNHLRPEWAAVNNPAITCTGLVTSAATD